jgi:hypothetical protein
MKKYEIRDEAFDGKVSAVYNENGLLWYLNFEDAQMSEENMQLCKEHIPANEANMVTFIKTSGSDVIEVSIRVTFEQWFKLFGMARNRERALKHWDKMPQTTRVIAYYNTKKYLKYCHRNAHWYNKMYPDTFLSPVNNHYLTDWDKIKH